MEGVGKRLEIKCYLNKLKLGTRIYLMDGVIMLLIWLIGYCKGNLNRGLVIMVLKRSLHIHGLNLSIGKS